MKIKDIFKNNNKTALIITAVVLFLCVLMAISYALYQLTITQEDSNILTTSSGCFNILFTDGDGITLENTLPIPDDEGLEEDSYTFTIKNMCNNFAKYQINLEVMAYTLAHNHVKVALDNTKSILTSKPPVETTVPTATDSYNLKEAWLMPDEEITYEFRFWMDYGTTKDEGNNKSFTGKIVIIAVPEVEPGMLVVSENDCPEVNDPFLGSPSPIERGNIETITFTNTNVVPGDATGWSVSDDNSVMAWYKAGVTTSMYDVWIGAKGGVYANPDSSFLFAGLKNLKSIDFTHFNESTAINMIGMFFETGENNVLFTLGDISGWNVSNVIDMAGMFAFAGASSAVFTLGSLSAWDVGSVTDMSNMFMSTGKSNNSFTLGNLSNWNVTNVRDMSHMFDGTGKTNLNFVLNLSNWNITNVETMESMFENTSYLVELRLDKWNVPRAMNMNIFNNSNNRMAPDNLKIYVNDSKMETWIEYNSFPPSNTVVNIVP